MEQHWQAKSPGDEHANRGSEKVSSRAGVNVDQVRLVPESAERQPANGPCEVEQFPRHAQPVVNRQKAKLDACPGETVVVEHVLNHGSHAAAAAGFGA